MAFEIYTKPQPISGKTGKVRLLSAKRLQQIKVAGDRMRWKRRKARLCLSCGKRTIDPKIEAKCDTCKVRHRVNQRTSVYRKVEKGICVYCPNKATRARMCSNCWTKQKAAFIRLRNKRKQLGLCAKCGFNPPMPRLHGGITPVNCYGCIEANARYKGLKWVAEILNPSPKANLMKKPVLKDGEFTHDEIDDLKSLMQMRKDLSLCLQCGRQLHKSKTGVCKVCKAN